MQTNPHETFQSGEYRGAVADAYRDAVFTEQLVRIGELVSGPSAQVISIGRNRNLRVSLSHGKGCVDVAIKCFGAQGRMKDAVDVRRGGSKAKRTWNAAMHLAAGEVGTPEPIAYLERWQGERLVESYFLALYQDGISSFADEFAGLFDGICDCGRLMTLLEVVAKAVRKMHDAGFQHNDLGNQNILLRREDDGAWGDVQFIDLNRGRCYASLTERQRARDISRICLPSDLLRVFKEMYYADNVPSEAFQKWEARHRAWYGLHSWTRPLRHPLRSFRHRGAPAVHAYPPDRDMWVWDRKSVQPINVMRSRTRLRHYPLSRHAKIAWAAIAGLGPVYREYKALLRTAFAERICLKDRIGVALEPGAADAERELELVKELGRLPVLLRFYHHKTKEEWEQTASLVKRLAEDGHSVSIALVQDRRAAKDPERWRSFVAWVLDEVGSHVEWVEVGHAVNRVKWGIWGFKEHRALLDAVAGEAVHLPKLKLAGPAVIDFEPLHMMAALRNVPPWMRFSALSNHLYVDRRGEPESRQGSFATLEKAALTRAMARRSRVCDDKVIVSEVNWPLKGTGVYSPVTSPYDTPGPRSKDPNVSEDDYADYMIRYLLITLCSGMVDRVYWWRLVARGFGLVDDSDASTWRERPAYRMVRQFLSFLGDATFVAKRGDDDVQVYSFEMKGKEIRLVYSVSGNAEYTLESTSTVLDAFGEAVPVSGPSVKLTGRPVYLIG